MKTLARVVCILVVGILFSATQASALIVAWDVAGTGSPSTATLNATTINSGVTGTPTLSRVGVTGTATSNAYNSNNAWNNSSTFTAGNKYIDFFITADGSDLLLADLEWAVTLSAGAPNQLTWGYSINGGSFTTTTVTMNSASATSLTTWDYADATLPAGQSVEFRMWCWGTGSASGGTGTANGTARIANVTGNDLVVTYSIVNIPEPSTITLIGFGLVGLLAFARRRKA